MRTLAALAVAAAAVVGTPERSTGQRPDQPHAVIVGRVIDAASREPLPGAAAILRRVPDGVADPGAERHLFEGDARVALSDAQGQYRFAELKPGRYRITVERLGYHPKAVEVELRGSATSRVTLGLTVEAIALEPLVVSTARPPGWRSTRQAVGSPSPRAGVDHGVEPTVAVETDVQRLTSSAFQRAISFGEPDIFRALQRYPGVTTRDGFTAEIWTRGAPWSQTRVYYDGLPLFDPVQTSGLTSGVTPLSVGTITFLPGSRSARRGAGIAGVIDLTSQTARSTDRRVRAGISAVSAQASVETRLFDDRAGLLLARRRSWWDLVAGGDGRPTRPPSTVDYSVSGGSGTLDLQIGGIQVLASWLDAVDQLDGNLPGAIHQSQGRWGNSLERVGARTHVGGVELEVAVGESRFEASVREDPALSPDPSDDAVVRLSPLDVGLEHGSILVEASGSAPAGVEGRFNVGVELVEQSLRQSGAALPLNAELRSELRSSTNERFEAFGELLFRPTERLAVRAGGRVGFWEKSSGNSKAALAPRLAARYQASERLAVSASVMRSHTYAQAIDRAGTAYGPQFFVAQTWALAGGAVPVAESDVRSLGLEYEVGASWTTSASFWSRDVAGVVVSDVRPGFLHPTSLDPDDPAAPFLVGRSWASGLELFVRGTEGPLAGTLAYSYTDANGSAAGVDYRAPSERPHVLDATLGLAVPRGLHLGLATTLASGAPFTRTFRRYCHDPPEGARCPAGAATTFQERPLVESGPRYASLDLAFRWSHVADSWGLRIWLQLHNVLGRHNVAAYEESVCPDDAFDGRGCSGAHPIDRFADSLFGPFPLLGIQVDF